jgi:hypothetical protein
VGASLVYYDQHIAFQAFAVIALVVGHANLFAHARDGEGSLTHHQYARGNQYRNRNNSGSLDSPRLIHQVHGQSHVFGPPRGQHDFLFPAPAQNMRSSGSQALQPP